MVAALLLLLVAAEPQYFTIQIVDADTGRGVPLVELRTVAAVRYVTDSNGIVAFHEPGLMGRKVFFHVKSHGYEFDKDGFGFRGKALVPKAGGRAVLKIKRINIAERLYRLTGSGIYRDSVLVGEKVPIRQPLLNGRVTGQDSVHAVPYKGKLFWLWGDTNRPGYPLGNFGVSAATSPLDVDPDKGIDFTYFVNKAGFSRPVCDIPGPGPKWIDGLLVVDGKLVGHYMRVKKLGELYEHGLVTWKDDTQAFERLVRFDVKKDKLHPHGHPVRVKNYFYFGMPFFNVRVKAELETMVDAREYEAWTKNGWKHGGTPVKTVLVDAATGKQVKPHNGSVYWNEHRKRWVAIVNEVGGTSYLGEVWYAEAKSHIGPWSNARKIVTHDRYSFYNVTQHPFLDRGKYIYFEGTYTDFLVKNADTTPRYNYNQVMYRLDLDDPRLRE